MSSVLTEIVTLLTAGLSSMATGIGGGLKSLVEAIFLDTSGTNPVLSTFGGIVVVFAAVALAFGLCRWVTNWLVSLGN